MKKLSFIIVLFLVSSHSFAQKLKEYKAINGITYKIGDTVKLDSGSGVNGEFLYLQMGGWGAVALFNSNNGSDQLNIGRGYAHSFVLVKKIKKNSYKGRSKVIFTVDGGNISNYSLLIDDAIDVCEVAPCKPTTVAN